MADSGVLTIHTDGASRGNPGDAAYAYVIERDGELLAEEAGCLGEMTNNQAEYTALVRALEHALDYGPEQQVIVHSDSELMVKQLNGQYRVKNEDLKPLYEEARDLAGEFKHRVTFRHVRRELNKRADQLCNEALDGKRLPSRVAGESRNGAPRANPKPAGVVFEESGADREALACLRAAADVWARGDPEEPAAEEVWRQLTAILRTHGGKPPPPRGR